MEIKREFEYILQYKGKTGIEAEDWFYFGWFANKTDALEALHKLRGDDDCKKFRIVERTIIDTVTDEARNN